jgi:hypothetical protein
MHLINVNLKQSEVSKHETEIHTAMALLTLLYGNKRWTITARDKTRITTSGMKFMKERHFLHCKIKEDVPDEVKDRAGVGETFDI